MYSNYIIYEEVIIKDTAERQKKGTARKEGREWVAWEKVEEDENQQYH